MVVQYHTMTTAQPPRAREYLRVSQDRSGRLRSVDEQHSDHAADAGREGWALGDPYAEGGAASASRYARKARGGFGELLVDLEADAFGAEILVMWEASRGSRRVDEWVRLLDLSEQRRIRIWVHTHHTLYDPANPRHRRTLLEDAVDSEYESAKTRDRSLRAMRANAVAGRPHGKLLYGYAREYDERGRYVRQVPHPVQAPLVREMAERVDAGESCWSIAQDLNRRGIPLSQPGRNGAGPYAGQWRLEQVKRCVTNPGVAGLRVHQGQVIGTAEWPALVPRELWSRVVARLTDPQRRTWRDATVKHLLTGVARCGVCGMPLRVWKQTPRGQKRPDGRQHVYAAYRAYMCSRSFHVAIKQAWLDEFVTELLLQRMEREDARDLFAPPDPGEAIEHARRELSDLESDLQGFYDQAAARKLSPTGLAEMEARLLPRIEELRARTVPASVPAKIRELPGPGARERWHDPDFGIALQRETAARVLDIQLMPGQKGGRHFDPGRVRWEWWTA